MKFFVFIFFISLNIFSQKIIVPVEEKGNHLTNNFNIDNYEFRDVNNVFVKFIGKWIYKDSINQIKIDINTYYDETNQQDAIYINMLFIKSSDTLINTLNEEKDGFISGGFFYNHKNINCVSVIFQDIIELKKKHVWTCGNISEVDLIYLKPNKLKWIINNRRSMFVLTKTAQQMPNNIEFTKIKN